MVLPVALFALFFLGLWLTLYYLLPQILHAGRSLTRAVAGRLLRQPKAARWIEAREHHVRAYLPVALVLAAGLAVTLIAGDFFLDLAEELRSNSPALRQADNGAHTWVAALRTDGATAFFSFFTTAGGPAGLVVVVAGVAAWLAVRRRFRWLAYLLVTAGGGALLNLELKRYFARARPDLSEALRQAHGFSFPSGHAMGVTVVAGAMTYLTMRVVHGWRARSAAVALALSLVVCVAVSRVYLGVHWLSDIAAGVVAGLLWVTTTTVAYETLRRIRAMRAKAAVRR